MTGLSSDPLWARLGKSKYSLGSAGSSGPLARGQQGERWALSGAPQFPPGGAQSGQHGQEQKAAAQWLGLCSRSCQTLSLARFLAGMTSYLLVQARVPCGALATLEPSAEERDLGWAFFLGGG